MSYKHVTFFLENGTTLRFENVTNFKWGDRGNSAFSFNYTSASDKLEKYAAFDSEKMVGISYCS